MSRILQHTATHCNTQRTWKKFCEFCHAYLQHTETHCNTLNRVFLFFLYIWRVRVFTREQRTRHIHGELCHIYEFHSCHAHSLSVTSVTVCCSVLQRVAACCSVYTNESYQMLDLFLFHLCVSLFLLCVWECLLLLRRCPTAIEQVLRAMAHTLQHTETQFNTLQHTATHSTH